MGLDWQNRDVLVSVNSQPLNGPTSPAPLCFLHQKLRNCLLLQTKQKIRKLPCVAGAASSPPDFTDAFLLALWEANIADVLASQRAGNVKIPLFQVLENSSSELKVTDGMEEMELSAAEQQGQDIAMWSPEKETCTETDFAQSGELKTHQTSAYPTAAWYSLCGVTGAL